MQREISLFFQTAHLSLAWSASLFSARRPAAKKGKTGPPQCVNYGIRGRVPFFSSCFFGCARTWRLGRMQRQKRKNKECRRKNEDRKKVEISEKNRLQKWFYQLTDENKWSIFESGKTSGSGEIPNRRYTPRASAGTGAIPVATV